MKTLPKQITFGAKYNPAMQIRTEAEAKDYFEVCVQHTMSHGNSREEAERIERQNLGYYAGYYDSETRERVERLFVCAHPVFGSIAKHGEPSPQTAFNTGMALGAHN